MEIKTIEKSEHNHVEKLVHSPSTDLLNFNQINFKAFQSFLLLHEITNETSMHLVTYWANFSHIPERKYIPLYINILEDPVLKLLEMVIEPFELSFSYWFLCVLSKTLARKIFSRWECPSFLLPFNSVKAHVQTRCFCGVGNISQGFSLFGALLFGLNISWIPSLPHAFLTIPHLLHDIHLLSNVCWKVLLT